MFAVFLGPYSFAGVGHAQHHQLLSLTGDHDHSATGHHYDPVQEDHSGIGHALTHCGSGSCAPSYVGTITNGAPFTTVSYRLNLFAGYDAMLASLYLDADPPVPRDGFSKA
jgi:hypothetical protein